MLFTQECLIVKPAEQVKKFHPYSLPFRLIRRMVMDEKGETISLESFSGETGRIGLVHPEELTETERRICKFLIDDLALLLQFF